MEENTKETPEAELNVDKTEAVAPEQNTTAQAAKRPDNVLLGAISYQSDEDFENFLSNLDINQAIFALITSANYCQSRGVFNVNESELIAKAIRTVKKNSKPTEAPVAEAPGHAGTLNQDA